MSFVRWVQELMGGGERLNVRRRFETEAKILSSSQSAVYKVKERKTYKTFALKISHPKLTRDYEARFAHLNKPTEGAIAAQLKHPNIIETFEQGETTAGEPFLLMEYFEGRGLHTHVETYPKLLEGQRLSLIRQIAGAIAQVHRQGFVHRDICPENFTVTYDGKTAKLTDFTHTVPKGPEFLTADRRTGRDEYMAPELMKPQEADLKIDVFAFGVMAYQICTGHLPWGAAASASSIARALRTAEDIKKYRPQISPTLAGAIHSCLLAKPAERMANVDEFLTRIQDLKSEDAQPAGAGGVKR
jgi:serine/threonine protein kinase